MEDEKKMRQMPKGGRKGGAIFPRLTLSDSVGYARKLVSKTHTGPQSKDIIYSGVVGTKGGKGDVRISALRQYDLLIGDTASKYSASALAKKIVASPDEELILLYRKSALNPSVFKKIFDTFHGDTVTKSKLKQRAADCNVHPDEADTCVDIYISSLTMAKLITVEADRVMHLAKADISDVENNDDKGEQESSDLDTPVDDALETELEEESSGERDAGDGNEKSVDLPRSRPRAVFNVNVTLDSSMDSEKLQKQLELLKRFGAI